MKKEYRCKYCGGKGSEFCSNCQEKLPLVRDIQTMVRNKVREVRKDLIEGWVLDYSSIDKILEKLSSNISVSDSLYKRLKELWKRFDCSSEPPHIHRETIRVVDYIGEFNF